MSVATADSMDMSGVPNGDSGPSQFNLADHIKMPQNSRLHHETQNLKKRVNELIEYQQAHPKPAKYATREDVDAERKIQRELDLREKKLKAQLSIVRTLYRNSVLKVREEKAETADVKAVNDALILGLHNLKYEEQSLQAEIAAAENYDHKYKKLPLMAPDDFKAKFPQYVDASPHEVMIAQIEHEHQDRIKLEERRQEKLKQKQKLIAEVKKSKDDLTRLDGMVEKFVEHFEPIRKVLATE